MYIWVKTITIGETELNFPEPKGGDIFQGWGKLMENYWRILVLEISQRE
jgi:hypothetical protein